MSRLLFAEFEATAPATWAVPVWAHPYWGPHFPDAVGGEFWGEHFPDGLQSNAVFPPYGPAGVATLIGFEEGFQVTYSWDTAINPHRDGTEQRVSNLDRPIQNYSGQVILVDAGPRVTRSRLARYAAQGQPFLLGLAHEGLTLLADASGSTLTVNSRYLALADWAQIGQRVIVATADALQGVPAVIQSTSGGSIVTDVAPGSIGNTGGIVMPAMAVLLDPQQDFARYVTNAEAWSVRARAAIFDFALPRASIDLGALNAAWAGAKLVARAAGVDGNVIDFVLNADAGNPAGGLLDEAPTETDADMKGDTDTLGDLATLLNATSSNFMLIGTYNAAALIASTDGFRATPTGGAASGLFGTGATLTMYDGHPVWDLGIENTGSNTDSVMALTEVLELGGVPYAIGNADYPSWPRALALTGYTPEAWQWAKCMLATLRGSQRVFWLPTAKSDLTWIATGVPILGVTGINIDTDDDIGAWYPAQRDRLLVQQLDHTATYCQILSATDNGDGTTTILVNAAISSSAVTMLSWLEPCRLEQDDVQVTFLAGGEFSFAIKARAHATTDPDLLEDE